MLNWIYPPKCISCRMLLRPAHYHARQWLCGDCEPLFIPIENSCARCGRPMAEESQNNTFCISCYGNEFEFEKNYAAFVYDGVIRDVIHDIKYGSNKRAAKGFGHLLAEVSSKWTNSLEGFEAIVPVPLHPSRKRRRGFNQAEIMAGEFSERLGVPLLSDMLIRVRKTHAQSGLSAQARENNVSGAFSISKKYTNCVPSKIILFDDIFTTGATLNACAKTLSAGGAIKIVCVSFSVTLKKD